MYWRYFRFEQIQGGGRRHLGKISNGHIYATGRISPQRLTICLYRAVIFSIAQLSCVYWGRRYENNDIFQKCMQLGLDFCCADLRLVGGTTGSKPTPAGWLACCSSALAPYSDVAGMSQSDWPRVFNNTGR